MIYYSSDFHLNHKNILRYCDRPFETVEDMNNHIFSLLSSVEYGDKVIHLGDLALKDKESMLRRIEDTGVELINIKGNHDTKMSCTIGNCLLKYNFAQQDVVLFEHKPSNECHHKDIFKALGIKVCVCGHVHNHHDWLFEDKYYAAYDPELDVVNVNVGIDCTQYKLLSESALINMIMHLYANKHKLHHVFEYRDENNNHVAQKSI